MVQKTFFLAVAAGAAVAVNAQPAVPQTMPKMAHKKAETAAPKRKMQMQGGKCKGAWGCIGQGNVGSLNWAGFDPDKELDWKTFHEQEMKEQGIDLDSYPLDNFFKLLLPTMGIWNGKFPKTSNL